MVLPWLTIVRLKLGRLAHNEFLVGFEHIALVNRVESKESIPIQRVHYHFIWRHTTKLDDFEHLIVIILPWKYGSFDK